MFAVVDVGGMRSPYVTGFFRDRKVPKVAKTSAVQPVTRETYPPEQHNPKGSSSFQSDIYEQVQAFTQASPSILVAGDIMASPVMTLPLTASLAQAWDVVKTKRFRHIPIQSQAGRLVGILSDRDLSRGMVESALSGVHKPVYLGNVTIEPYISHPVLVADLEATLLGIARVLLEERIGALPVVTGEMKLLGMITRSDILRVIVSHPNFERWG